MSGVDTSESLDDRPPEPLDPRVASVLEAVGMALVVTDTSARVRFMNGTARALHGLLDDTGYVGEEYGSGFDMFDRQGRPLGAASSPVWRAAQGRHVHAEVIVVRFAGDDAPRLWEYSASIADADSPSPAVVLTIRDSPDAFSDSRHDAERRALEESCQNSQSLDSLLELLPIGAAICDDKGKMLAMNTRIEEIWGGSPSPNNFDEFGMYRARWVDTGEPVLTQDWAMYRAVMSGETSRGELLDIERFDGGRATILNSAAPIRNERGAITGAIAIMTDVTESMRRERLGRRLLHAVPEILRAQSVDERIGVVTRLLDTVFMGSTAFAVIQEAGGLALADGTDPPMAALLEHHASDVWGALKSLRAQVVAPPHDSGEASLLIIPIQSADASGCFMTMTRDGERLHELDLDVAQQIVELLPSVFMAPCFKDESHQTIAGYSHSLAGPLGALLSDGVLGFEEPGWISSRVLQLLMEHAQADYGRVVEQIWGDFEPRFHVLSEVGVEEGTVPVESLGVLAATVMSQPVMAADGTEAPDSAGYGSFASFPFVTDSGTGAMTLAWRSRRDPSNMYAGDLGSVAVFLGLLLSGSQLRARLQRAQKEHSFVSAVAAAASSSFDAAGIQDAVSHVMKRHFGSDVAMHLFRMDSARQLREVAPTFNATPAAVCDWSQVEQSLGDSSTGTVLIAPESNPLCRSLSLGTDTQAVLAVLRLRGRPIGVMMTILSRARDVDASMLSLLDAAAREVAEALAIAEYRSAQARIAMRTHVADEIEGMVGELTDEDDVIDAALRTTLAVLKADGVAHMKRAHAGWQVAARAGHVEEKDAVRTVEAAMPSVWAATARLADDGTAMVSSVQVDGQLWALAVFRSGYQVPFSKDDLELLYRIHTAISRAIRSLRSARERESVQVTWESWLADISHDLKTPLSAILGYAELLSGPGDTPPDEVKREAGRISHQATEIQRLLDNLLLLLRIRAKTLPLEVSVQDANDVASEAVKLVLADPRAAGVSVSLEAAPSSIPIEIDRRLLVRAISNVTMNAVLHGGAGVHVRVSVSSQEGACRIEIADDGKGIDEANLERVFDRYYRGESAPGDQAGSGLGLPIARELVELMGGTLGVASLPGQGATIGIEFVRAE